MTSHSHCENCFKVICDQVSCKLIDCQQGCGFRMHECKQQDHLDSICSRVRVPCINSEFGCNSLMVRNDLRKHLVRCPASVVSCAFENNRRTVQRIQMGWSKWKKPFPQEFIRDDTTLTSNIETLTRAESDEFNATNELKPKPICGGDFRRDEYCSHYRNVHCDIMSSLNGWMEKFCPNQQYGCMFNARRIVPICNNEKTKIVYGKQNKAFGHVVMDGEDNSSISQEVYLTDLPVELISHILSYLDAFSLNNIALTNMLLRSLCCSHLERRGMVTLIWKKEVNQINWTVVGFRWKFSNHFSFIKKWTLENEKFLNHFANDCKHFDKLIHKEPFQLIGIGIEKKKNSFSN